MGTPASPPVRPPVELEARSVAELRKMASALGLATKGRKAVLVERIRGAQG